MFGGIGTKKAVLTCGYIVGLPDAKHSEGDRPAAGEMGLSPRMWSYQG
jgi:hypothetical protein